MLQVITRAVYRAVFVVITHVRAVGVYAMCRAVRKLSQQLQVVSAQCVEIVVFEVVRHVRSQVLAGINMFPDVDKCSLVNITRSGEFAGRACGESNDPEQISVVFRCAAAGCGTEKRCNCLIDGRINFIGCLGKRNTDEFITRRQVFSLSAGQVRVR